MHILLLNTNPVVSRLISLCIREDNVTLEEVTDLENVQRQGYDLLFVDDASYGKSVETFLERVTVVEKVFLAGKSTNDVIPECFGSVLKKPFLPSQISEILKQVQILALENEEESHFIFPLSSVDDVTEEPEKKTEEEREELPDTNEEEDETVIPSVLNNSEIEKIKALLDDNDELDIIEETVEEDDIEARKIEVITEHLEADGLEIVSEDEMLDLLSQIPKEDSLPDALPDTDIDKKEEQKKKKEKKEKKRAKKAKKIKEKKKREESYTFEEALIAAIEGMKVKKIKKLLKDANISIQISFKD